MTSTDDNIACLKELYQAYGEGNIEPVIAALDEDVRWCSMGSTGDLPWLGQCHGFEGVVNYFQTLAASITVNSYEPEYFVADGDRVVAIVSLSITHNATGRTSNFEKADVFRFRDGKILEFTEFYDTAGVAALCCP